MLDPINYYRILEFILLEEKNLFLLLVVSLSDFGMKVMLAFSIFFKLPKKHWCSFFFKHLEEFINNVIWTLSLPYLFNLSEKSSMVPVGILPLNDPILVKCICPFLPGYQFWGPYSYSWEFLTALYNFHGVSHNIFIFISDFVNLSLCFSVAKKLSICFQTANYSHLLILIRLS